MVKLRLGLLSEGGRNLYRVLVHVPPPGLVLLVLRMYFVKMALFDNLKLVLLRFYPA